MPKVRITEQYLTDISNAIREKNGENDTYQPVELAEKIKEFKTVSDIDLSGYAKLDTENIFTNTNTFNGNKTNINGSVNFGSSSITASENANFLFSNANTFFVPDPTMDKQAATKKYVDDKIIIKTAKEWETENTILALNTIGFESDTRYSKTGDGITAWNDLPYNKAPTETNVIASIQQPDSADVWIDIPWENVQIKKSPASDGDEDLIIEIYDEESA